MEFIKYLLLGSFLLNVYYVYEYIEYIPFKYAISETSYEFPQLRGRCPNDNCREKHRQKRQQRLRLKRKTHGNNFA
jgi:hypothetical protein